MQKLAMELLVAIIIACVPILTGYATNALKEIASKAAANCKNTLAAMCIREIADAVSMAVESVNQTYVDSIKNSSEPFTVEQQRLAFHKAYNVAVASLSASTKKFIEENYESLESYLTSKIEAEVRSQKNGTTTMALQVFPE